MKLRIASYNISGSIYQNDDSTDYLDRKRSEDIDTRLLNNIVDNINQEKLDIICFQEIITTDHINYISRIIERTDLKHAEIFELSPCNTVENANCGLATLSKYPIIDSIKQLFTNPMLSKTTTNGNTYYTYDKGFLLTNIQIDNKKLSILNNHNFPFRRFNSTAEENVPVFVEFDNYVNNLKPNIIIGDFNSEHFLKMTPYTNKHYRKTINDPTTDDGMHFDNILLPNQINYTTKILSSSLSDHFMIIAEIDTSQFNTR
ncbi:endonuclease/exonuclease/phosphatase family protein [Candidatus Saccharibacteria bacterium]|nr:endonuclease/exonuclease/phosphatase family protein [Candidatus Saccharibacteria bacterium]